MSGLAGAPAVRHRGPAEAGSITPYVVLIFLAVLAGVGLVYDGGNILNGRREAATLASSSARIGAQAVDENAALGGSGPLVDQGRAQQLVDNYLATTGTGASATVTYDAGANVVVVEVEMTVQLDILRLGGLDTRQVSATRTATPTRGVNGPGS